MLPSEKRKPRGDNIYERNVTSGYQYQHSNHDAQNSKIDDFECAHPMIKDNFGIIAIHCPKSNVFVAVLEALYCTENNASH